MTWTEQVENASEPIFQKIIQSPFIVELIKGTLQPEKFIFYLEQDNLYLFENSKVLATIASKSNDIELTQHYYEFAELALLGETQMHNDFFITYGKNETIIMQPATHHYVHFLKSTVAFNSLEVAVAATLPCFCLYQKVGKYIAQQPALINNPFQSWIDLYASNTFDEPTQQAKNIANKLAENSNEAIKQQMTNAYLTAAHLEFEFWQSAYDMKQW